VLKDLQVLKEFKEQLAQLVLQALKEFKAQ
jgi:hypothetical protein